MNIYIYIYILIFSGTTPKIYFCSEEWALGYVPMKFLDFPNIYLFSQISRPMRQLVAEVSCTTLFALIFTLSHKKIHLREKISTEFTLKKAMREI